MLPLLRADIRIELSPTVTAVDSCREQTEYGVGGFFPSQNRFLILIQSVGQRCGRGDDDTNI